MKLLLDQEKLYRKRTFQKFLAIMADDWSVPHEAVAAQGGDSEEIGHAVEGIVLPKQNLVKFFNKNADAISMRLDQHYHHKMTQTKRQCIICH